MGTPRSAAAATRRRQPCCDFSTISLKYGIQEQVRQVRVLVVRFLDPSKEPGPDDAPPAPDGRDLSELERPPVLPGRSPHQAEALRVRADLGGIQGVMHRLYQLGWRSPRYFPDGPRRTFEAAVLSSFMRGDGAGKNGLRHGGRGDPEIQRGLDGPFARVPFCPALSRICSTRGSPVSGSFFPRMSAVIWIR